MKLNYLKTFKVGLAFAIIMMFWQAYDFVVPLLLENAFGLSNAMRGLIMGLDNLLSLFLLPIFGKISDKANGKFAKKAGRRTPFIVIGTIIAVLLMVFVPVSAKSQLDKANAYREDSLHYYYNTPYELKTTLAHFYDEANDNGNMTYCDLEYLNKNDVSRDEYINLKYYDKFEKKSGLLGIGGTTYFYDGVEISEEEGKIYAEANGKFDSYVSSGLNTYISEQVNEKFTKQNPTTLIIYMIILFFVLVAMATFRSPAVALMPDVTPKPLRSQANAIINLCGGAGGAIAFLIYTIGFAQSATGSYTKIFLITAGCMLALLAFYLIFVKEKKFVNECNLICEEYGISNDDDDGTTTSRKIEEPKQGQEKTRIYSLLLEKRVANGRNGYNSEYRMREEAGEATQSPVQAKTPAEPINAEQEALSPEENAKREKKLHRAKNRSFILILASIFMWFMGYNAISSNLSVYCTKVLNLQPVIASIISGVSMGFSAIAFIPVGFLAVKIGRRKSIILGFALATLSFVLLWLLVRPGDIAAYLFAVFYLIAGFGLIIANVNTFPMVVELAKAEDVGKYTGFYYVATMSAQAITPYIAGLVMDSNLGSNYLFCYSAVCVVLAIVIMLFVRHGDSKQLPKQKLSKEEKKQLLLDSMGDAD